MTFPLSRVRRVFNPKTAHDRLKTSLFLLATAVSTLGAVSSHAAVEPLSVNGSQILVGGKAQGMAGNSFFWSNTGWGAEKFYNADAVRWLKTDFKANIVRAAMGVEEGGAYLQQPAQNKARVKAVVDAAIAEDMYVIIDWHTHHAEDHRQAAIDFFTEMAKTYGKNNNVIYEIYNEPLQISWSDTIKPYAEAVIAAIRAVDPDNLIIVGTPTWSQDVDKAAADPITGYSNIAYTLHFYAGTHKAWLRDRAERAMNAGIALMVTEWGGVNADGNGALDVAETNAWVNWMQEYNLIHLNWAVNDKAEGSSLVKPGSSGTGNWPASALTESGRYIRTMIREYNAGNTVGDGTPPTPPNPTPPTPTPPTPSSPCDNAAAISVNDRVQAEAYCEQQGIRTQATSDAGGTDNIGWIDNGDWAEYRINVPAAGRYTLDARVASDTTGGDINVSVGSNSLATITVANTGGWQRWRTNSATVELNAGIQTLRLSFAGPRGGLLNVNWLEFAAQGTDPTPPNPTPPTPPTPPSPPTPPTPTPPTSGVSCQFEISNEWPSGFVAEVKITNNGTTAVSGDWAVSFRFTDGSSLSNGWNGNFTGSNPHTVTPYGWNSTIAPGQTTSFGLQASKGTNGLAAPTPLVTGAICN